MARADRWGSGTWTTLVPLPHTRSYPVAVLLAEVGDVGTGGFEDSQAEQAEHGHQREVVPVR